MPSACEHWPIFVISLHDAIDRRSEIARQLHDLGLSFEIVDATDGRTGLTRQHESLIDRPGTFAALGRNMTNPEYACALSHLRVWQRVLDRGLPGAVILEDDAILDRTFADFLRAQGYDAAPLILLDHEKARVWFWTKSLQRHEIRLYRIAANCDRTTGYTISARGANFLAANSLPLRGPADWPCDITALRTLAAIPRLVDRPDNGLNSAIDMSRNTEFLQKRERRKTAPKRLSRYFRLAKLRKKFLMRLSYRIS